jgi:hypothetical protein
MPSVIEPSVIEPTSLRRAADAVASIDLLRGCVQRSQRTIDVATFLLALTFTLAYLFIFFLPVM